MENNVGYVYYSVSELDLKKYIDGEITLSKVYDLSQDFIVKFKSRGRIKSYFKEDLINLIVLGDKFYNQIPNDMK